jgi:uncharacterized protein YecA (UPF0149 family)
MDTRTGEILTEAEAMFRDSKYIRKCVVVTPDMMARRPPRVLPNEKCPCGSGKKFKRCCLYRGDNMVKEVEG